MKSLTIFLLSFLFFSPTFFAQNNYYVSTIGNNSHAGTLMSPWQTIQFALNQAIAGDVIYVMAGTYQEKLFWTNSGLVNMEITLTRYQNDEVILSGAGLSSPQDMIAISSKSHLIIDGLTIENNYIQEAKGIYIVGEGTNITIQNCIIQNIGFNNNPATDPASVNPTGQAHGILVNGRTNNGYTDITISNNVLANLITGNSEALTFVGNNSNFLINNNLLHDNTNIGIDIAGHFSWAVESSVNPILNQSRNGQVTNNTVYNHKRFNNVDAPAGIYVDGGKNVLIERNICYQNGNGISAGCENAGKAAEDIIIRNNVIFNNINNGIVFGANTGNLNNSEIRNNTLLKNGSEGNFLMEIFLQKSTNCLIANNILYARSPSHYGIGIFSYDAPNLTINKNLLFREGGNLNDLVVEDDTNTPLNDINSIFQNPLLVNVSLLSPDLHLQANSPAKDSGENSYVSFNETDIDGETRVQEMTIDLGADEFSVTLATAQVATLKAKLIENGVYLQWSVPSYADFTIEKSNDGHSWSGIGDFNSNSIPKEMIDRQVLIGKNYYRLRWTSENETVKYSNMEVIEWKKIEPIIFPNPSTGLIFIPAAKTLNLYLNLYDDLGKLVKSGVASEVLDLPKGTYLLELKTENQQILAIERVLIH